MKKIATLFIFINSIVSSMAQVPGATGTPAVKWRSLGEAEILFKKLPLPIFIDAYTDWCGWCKKMDRDTFTNPVIADILNNKFYPVKFDAEGSDSITFLGKTYINDGKYGRTHQLGIALLNGQLSYPTVVFVTLEKTGISVLPVPGYRAPADMEILLSYISDKAYLSREWEEYQKNFVSKIK
jgi:thioredoxin-related protein